MSLIWNFILYIDYRIDKKGQMRHFAICPECSNPIQIINLYKEIYEEDITKSKKMHARHYPHNLPGLANYYKAAYDNCNLSGRNLLGIHKIRTDKFYNAEMKRIIENNKNIILRKINEIIGINLGKIKDDIFQTFMTNQYYQYIGANKFNIPYSILFFYKSIPLYGQYVRNSNIGDLISSCIQDKSKLFHIVNNQIVKHDFITEHADIFGIIINHEKIEGKQYLTWRITESCNDYKKRICEIKIEVHSIILEE